MKDYRLEYLAQNTKDELFKIIDVGVNFTLQGDKGTMLEMKPVVPRVIVVDKGDSIMTVGKNGMSIKNKTEPRREQMTMEMADNG
jgi:hypothetical protein